MSNTMSLNDLHRLLEEKGKRGATLLSFLGKQIPFIEALSSEVGNECLKDLISITESRLQKIICEEADEKDKAEYRVAKEILSRWAGRLETYSDSIKKLGEVENG